jgi:Xaa-Pro aminopeptidase
MREIKDADELATLERALAVTDRVFVDATSGLTAGVTERELATEIDRLFREHADGPAFGTIVAVGDHAARPHHAPSDRPIAEGEPIIIDMGALVDGYRADLTRTIWMGEPSERLKAVYNVVHQAQQAAIAAIQPGRSARAVDAAARELIAAAGYGDHFVHGLGHGIGLRIHEGPSMSETSDDVLRPGQVTTIEPGVYLKDWGGVRIEDVGVVEPEGFRIITRAPKNALVK